MTLIALLLAEQFYTIIYNIFLKLIEKEHVFTLIKINDQYKCKTVSYNFDSHSSLIIHSYRFYLKPLCTTKQSFINDVKQLVCDSLNYHTKVIYKILSQLCFIPFYAKKYNYFTQTLVIVLFTLIQLKPLYTVQKSYSFATYIQPGTIAGFFSCVICVAVISAILASHKLLNFP